MEFSILASTNVFPFQDLVDKVIQEVRHEYVHIEASFMSSIGRNTLTNSYMEQVPFHLEKDWEIARIF